jgi:site-specific DNA-methyltransferase (adenine-specific)
MSLMNHLYNGDCLDVLRTLEAVDTVFADPPDNIGLGYASYRDKLSDDEYASMLSDWLHAFIYKAKTVWFSFNAKWTFVAGRIVENLIENHQVTGLEAKPCVQTFTFGQHSHHDLGNNHRPLWRLSWRDAPLYPDAIRVPSWRQENGDKRADPRGRVPGDVFDFTRVTGNSKQRRAWHPTQLNEGLVERCLRLTTPPGGTVLDPFGGTGTTLRVCKRLELPCTLIELDRDYCKRIAEENALTPLAYPHRSVWEGA